MARIADYSIALNLCSRVGSNTAAMTMDAANTTMIILRAADAMRRISVTAVGLIA